MSSPRNCGQVSPWSNDILVRRRAAQKVYHDKKVRVEDITIGNWVLLREMRAAPKKFEPRWLGPYKVTKKLGRTNFAIRRSAPLGEDGTEPSSDLQTEEVVHKNRIKRYGGHTKQPLQPISEEETDTDDSSRDAPRIEPEPSAPTDEQIVVPPETDEPPVIPEPPVSRYTLRRVIRAPNRLDL